MTMPLKFEKLMDSIGEKIIQVLTRDGRIPYSRLGTLVGLSTPAVTERVRKMEEAGIILGYHARIQKQESKNRVLAFVELTAPSTLYDRVKRTAKGLDQVLECHHISGDAAFILKVESLSVGELEKVISQFSPFGSTRTSIVMSSSKSGE
jgi:Lrp/AsnC family leucine-responsive transcriptional regulator